METFLRLATGDELDTVMKIYEDARLYEGCVWGDDYPTRDIMLEDFENRALYVYVSKNEIIGAISAIFDEDLEKFDCWKIQDEKQISFARVVIAKDFLHQGHGRKMVEEFMRMLKEKGHSSIRILVSPKNIAAMSIYRHLDFEFYHLAEVHEEEFWLCEKVVK